MCGIEAGQNNPLTPSSETSELASYRQRKISQAIVVKIELLKWFFLGQKQSKVFLVWNHQQEKMEKKECTQKQTKRGVTQWWSSILLSCALGRVGFGWVGGSGSGNTLQVHVVHATEVQMELSNVHMG